MEVNGMSITAMKMALEALEAHADIGIKCDKIITALRTAIEAAEKQEPVAWMIEWNDEPTGNLFRNEGYATREMKRLNMLHPQDRRSLVPLYTTPPAAYPEFECPRCGHYCARGQA
jgi:hypothetical protein